MDTHRNNSCSRTAHPESCELFDNLWLQHVFVDAILFDANIAKLTGISVIDKHLNCAFRGTAGRHEGAVR